MKLSFHGAARQVTGSMFLLEFDDEYKVLIDCGSHLEGGNIKFHKYEYGLFPFDASLVNLLILTHAHVDHSGQIPNLYLSGFEGQVLCTAATSDLAEILLYDVASLNQRQMQRTEKDHKRSKKWREEAHEGLYLSRNVDEALSNFVSIPFKQRFRFKDHGFLTFIPAGHLLGAAHVLIEYEENAQKKSIVFSGDIGRKNYPLLVDPQSIPEADVLVMETTYGSRKHEDKAEAVEILKDIVQKSCIDIPGRLIIPAFSVGRSQALLYTLNRLYHEYNFKPIKVFTDSPLAQSSTKVHEKHRGLLNKEAKEFWEENGSLFDFENLEYLKSTKDSQQVSSHTEPCIIISASGMIKGGRVEYHIAQNIENPYATILMVGYASEDSLGGKLLSGQKEDLMILGKKHSVKANIMKTDIFSGHADIADLESFVETQSPDKLKKLFLVHGEYHAMLNFKEILNNKGFHQVEIPEMNSSHQI
jgi:metallo-beta-lactamase family protein